MRFAHYSYEDTKLRDIAADVGVDVAFVHRSFGSKAQLFSEAVNAAFQPGQVLQAEGKALSAALAARVLEPSLDKTLSLVDPLDIVIRSLLSPEAIPIIREALAKEFVEPLAAKLGSAEACPETRRRAALAAACLAGISIFRNVLRDHSLVEEGAPELAEAIRRILECALQPAASPETVRKG